VVGATPLGWRWTGARKAVSELTLLYGLPSCPLVPAISRCLPRFGAFLRQVQIRQVRLGFTVLDGHVKSAVQDMVAT